MGPGYRSACGIPRSKFEVGCRAAEGPAGYISRNHRTLLAHPQSRTAQGHAPSVVVETSPGRLQAWIRVSREPHPPSLATDISRRRSDGPRHHVSKSLILIGRPPGTGQVLLQKLEKDSWTIAPARLCSHDLAALRAGAFGCRRAARYHIQARPLDWQSLRRPQTGGLVSSTNGNVRMPYGGRGVLERFAVDANLVMRDHWFFVRRFLGLVSGFLAGFFY
ncbi:MAG: hypothetical protein DMG57_19490 [Acidobacteria bacterium]|nr:MAG: hypothetical protein DMG57_19490 [Acidobacteriota bacterium]